MYKIAINSKAMAIRVSDIFGILNSCIHFLIHICDTCSFLGIYLLFNEMTDLSMSMSMSMSMMVDRHSGRKEWTIRPSLPVTWIPDERVKRCFGCGASFSTFRRKHHCRSCGRVFCSACSAYRELIPSYYFSFSGVMLNTPQRTCASCAQSLKRAAEVEHLIRMISIMPIMFDQLFQLRLLDKQWNYAVNTMLSIFRGMQYKLSCQEYSTLECDFLRTHYKEFCGHVAWQIHTVVSFKQSGLVLCAENKEVYQVPCRRLMCSRICHSVLSVEDILRLGYTEALASPEIQIWVIDAWHRMSPDAHVMTMQWWVHFACRFKDLFKKGLIPICSQRIELAYALWFECELQKTDRTLHILQKVQKHLEKNLTTEIKAALVASQDLANCFRCIINAVSKEKRGMLCVSFFQEHGPTRLPWDTKVVIIRMTVIKQLTSSSKPFVLQLTRLDGFVYNVLLKHEDVRTDRLAMIIGYWINHLTGSCKVFTYDVFPLDDHSGVVQMIPSTTTLYDIRNSNITLLNYIMTANESLHVKTLRQRVIRLRPVPVYWRLPWVSETAIWKIYWSARTRTWYTWILVLCWATTPNTLTPLCGLPKTWWTLWVVDNPRHLSPL